jgi:hypothetical protein
MSIIDDINSARDAAIKILDGKLAQANGLKAAGEAGMDAVIDSLEDQEAAVTQQAYAAAQDDPTMLAALKALNAATTEMKTVAAQMISATTFISNIASLGTATGKVVSALKTGT